MLQVEIDQNVAKLNLKISYILTLCDLQWLKLTFKCTFLKSVSNLQPEKVPYQYIWQLKILTFI
jgi:hypothetical protein